MQDWDRLIADENLFIQTHYTPGRGGNSIKYVVLHHNAGNLSGRDCYNVWQTREASAHYQVDINGRITQLVDDRDTAWHSGNWDINTQSIGIEHADATFDPTWTISDATLDNGAHLVAAICHAYGLGRPTWKVNVFPHGDFTQTSCPGAIGGAQNAAYMQRAQQWFDAMSGGAAPDSNNVQPVTPIESTVVHYALRTLNGDWLEEVTNFNNSDEHGFAGIPHGSHDYLYVKVDEGDLKYRVHVLGGDWLDWVSKGDKNDLVNGCAGIAGSPIDGVQIYYTTPEGKPFQQAWYRAQTASREGWLPVACDDGTTIAEFDDFAGMLGEPLDRLQIAITNRNPF